METILTYQSELMLGALAFIVLVALILLFRKPPAPVRDPALVEELSRAQSDLGHSRAALAEASAERDRLREAFAGEQVKAGRLETERDSLTERLRHLAEQHAQALEKTEDGFHIRIAALEDKLRNEAAELNTRAATIAGLTTDKRVLEDKLEVQERKHAELRQEIETNRQHFVNQFKAISSELLQNQGRMTTEAQKNELEKLLTPFKQELGFLKTGIREMTEKADKERQTLGQQIQLMQAKATELAEEANSLAHALRGDKKRQGNWGETILERILEAAGLVEGTHFSKQATTTDDEGRRLIPDIVVHLPGERDVIIDSKVTLVAYQDMILAAEDPEREEAALKRHVTALKAHMNALSKKSYDDLGFDSIDSVLMFLPIEGALSAALTREPDLVLEAAEKRVHIMTPSTLMPILKIVDHLWTIDNRNRNVDEIVDRAGRLHDKFVSVVESIDEIGRHLKKASDVHGEAFKRMSEGPGNVLRQVDQLRELGAKSRKAIPQHLMSVASAHEASDDEDNSQPGLLPPS